MTNDTLLSILRYIKLPRGTLLDDGTTYRLIKHDFPPRKFKDGLEMFDKLLVLSDGNYNAVGGVLFYGPVDIQATTLPKYRGQGYMSAISRNGILRSECYEDQQVSIYEKELRTMDDFLMKYHLIETAGLKVKNLPKIYKELVFWRAVDMSEEEFIRTYG